MDSKCIPFVPDLVTPAYYVVGTAKHGEQVAGRGQQKGQNKSQCYISSFIGAFNHSIALSQLHLPSPTPHSGLRSIETRFHRAKSPAASLCFRPIRTFRFCTGSAPVI